MQSGDDWPRLLRELGEMHEAFESVTERTLARSKPR
jgi:hypothetical protein